MKLLKNRRCMGIGRFLIPVPRMISSRGLERAVAGARAKAGTLSDEERRIHHFIVKKMTEVDKPITAGLLAGELDLPRDMVEKTIDKLEEMKTFVYRSDGEAIDWAYPLSLDNTGHRMTAGNGERFFAAWAVDAFATPFVYGRLLNRKFNFTIQTECANSGRKIEIELDSDLDIARVTKGSDPAISLTVFNSEKMKEKSIVDIFWRQSLFFWSEEDAREYQRKTRQFKVYMGINPVSLEGIKKMQSAIFGFW